MPYKKDKRPYSGIGELIASRKINTTKLSKILGCSEATAWRRLNDIGELRIRDLYAIIDAVHISKEELKGKL